LEEAAICCFSSFLRASRSFRRETRISLVSVITFGVFALNGVGAPIFLADGCDEVDSKPAPLKNQTPKSAAQIRLRTLRLRHPL